MNLTSPSDAHLPSPSPTLAELTLRLRAFAAARGWEVYHNPKNLAMALAVEAAELMEPFQWLTPEEAAAVSTDPARQEAVEDELADVGIYLLRLADLVGVDLTAAMAAKIERNEGRFPVG
jgi:NTP pyrophosphatase (non-canonical NTP hydrolase)